MKPTGYESIPMQTLPDVVEAAKVALAEALAELAAAKALLAAKKADDGEKRLDMRTKEGREAAKLAAQG